MAWVTPKTDWHPTNAEAVAGDDFNRIEGNTLYLKPTDILLNKSFSATGVDVKYNAVYFADQWNSIYNISGTIDQTTSERKVDISALIPFGGFSKSYIDLLVMTDAQPSWTGAVRTFINRNSTSDKNAWAVNSGVGSSGWLWESASEVDMPFFVRYLGASTKAVEFVVRSSGSAVLSFCGTIRTVL